MSVDLVWQRFEPVAIVTTQRDVNRNDVLGVGPPVSPVFADCMIIMTSASTHIVSALHNFTSVRGFTTASAALDQSSSLL